MELLYEIVELLVDTMNELPPGAIIALGFVVAPPLVLLHELGHAARHSL